MCVCMYVCECVCVWRKYCDADMCLVYICICVCIYVCRETTAPKVCRHVLGVCMYVCMYVYMCVFRGTTVLQVAAGDMYLMAYAHCVLAQILEALGPLWKAFGCVCVYVCMYVCMHMCVFIVP